MSKLLKFILAGLVGTYTIAGILVGTISLFCFLIDLLSKSPFLAFLVLLSLLGVIIGIVGWACGVV